MKWDPGSESSWEQTFLSMKILGPIHSGQQKFQEAKGPWCESSRHKSSREWIGQGPIETFAPGNELAQGAKRLATWWNVIAAMTDGGNHRQLVSYLVSMYTIKLSVANFMCCLCLMYERNWNITFRCSWVSTNHTPATHWPYSKPCTGHI